MRRLVEPKQIPTQRVDTDENAKADTCANSIDPDEKARRAKTDTNANSVDPDETSYRAKPDTNANNVNPDKKARSSGSTFFASVYDYFKLRSLFATNGFVQTQRRNSPLEKLKGERYFISTALLQ